MNKAKFALSSILGLILGSVVTLSSSPAFAYSLNRGGVANYAHQYACNVGDCHNPSFPYLRSTAGLFPTDCTNFASQALSLGGNLPQMPENSYTPWWHSGTATSFVSSLSWSHVSNFYSTFQNASRISSVAYPPMYSKLSGALQGDIYMYDWGKGEGFSHFSVATGDGTFTNFQEGSINYVDVTGGTGSHMAQHSPDRDWAPWNWGFWKETDLASRGKMKTAVLHISATG